MVPAIVNVAALIEAAKELEPLPASSTRLAALVTSGEAELEEIARTIQLDEALTGRLLGAANSALSGSRFTIVSVEQAVLRLGPGAVLALALGSKLGAQLAPALPGYGLSEGDLWRHSVAAALAVERSRRYCRRKGPPEAFAAALLHDVGKLVLSRHLSEEAVAAMCAARESRGLAMDDAEREVLGIGHAALGAQVVRHWGLPETIAEAVEHHHAPLDASSEEARRLCSLIGLADAVAREVQASCGVGSRCGFSPAIAGSLGISREGFADLCEDVAGKLEEVLALYGG